MIKANIEHDSIAGWNGREYASMIV
jgi:hypothetical protein